MVENNSKKAVRYIDTSVHEEAKNRIRHVIDTFDTLAVCFSGGKDSLTILHIVEEVYKDLGISEPINVVFRDEELIPDDIVDFVLWHAAQPKYRFYYYCVQLKSSKFILGKTYTYIQWDENREWVRKKPDIAICEPGAVFDQYTMDEYCARPFPGKVAFITGIRADESLIRFQSCVSKKNENYINSTSSANVKLVKPIYDWTERDVFKYFYDRQIKYCPTYDKQMWNNQALRVATPLHAESSKNFDKLRTLYPVFYEQIISIFPEMLVQERYWKEYDRYGAIYSYPYGWKGILDYIKAEITDPAMRKLATSRVIEAAKTRKNHLAAGRYTENFGGYPMLYVFKAILAGSYKRTIQPTKKPTKEESAYEKRAAEVQ